MSKQPTPKQYSGALSSRLKCRGGEFPTDLLNEYCALPPTISRHFIDEVIAEIHAASFDYTEERLAKLPALFAHYGISMNAPNCWRNLALALAYRHERGFQIASPKGAKLARPWFDFELWGKVRLMQLEGKHSVRRACDLLSGHNNGKGESADLRRRFTAANKKLGPLYGEPSIDGLKRDLLAHQSQLPKKTAAKRLNQ